MQLNQPPESDNIGIFQQINSIVAKILAILSEPPIHLCRPKVGKKLLFPFVFPHSLLIPLASLLTLLIYGPKKWHIIKTILVPLAKY